MKILLVGDLIFLVVSVYKKTQRTWYYNFWIVSLIMLNVYPPYALLKPWAMRDATPLPFQLTTPS